jgi:GNAT superfamily N-acetyltransferase
MGAMSDMTTRNDRVTFRMASTTDLGAIVALLRDDEFGLTRNPDFDKERDHYNAAFAEMSASCNNGILVMEQGERIVGIAQLTFIRGLSYTGGLRAQVESVRITRNLRGQGLGAQLMQEAVKRARLRGCVLVQLTTDVRRNQTRRFYERLGFATSHHGMKLWL